MELDGYIDLYGVLNISDVLGVYTQKKFNKYLRVIKSNPEHYKKFLTLNEFIIKTIDKQYKEQRGGSTEAILPLVFSGLSSSMIVSSIVAYILFRIFTRPKCKPTYPIYPEDKVPELKDVIMTLIPEYAIPGAEDMDIETYLDAVNQFMDIIRIPLEIISPSSLLGNLATGTIEVAAGIGVSVVTVLTAGVGAVLNYLLKFITLLKEAIGFLFGLIDVIQGLGDLLVDSENVRFVYDILNIDFRDGPFGVKCWVEYIMNKYGENTSLLSSMCIIFNNIADKIADKLIKFISKAITISIPDGGISGVLLSAVLMVLKSGAYGLAIIKLNQAYNKFSYDTQLLFEKPLLMKANLEKVLKSAESYIRKLGDNVYEILYNNTAFFAFTINKVFALVYALLYVFSKCV